MGLAAAFAALAFLAGAMGYFGISALAADLAWIFCIVALALIVAGFAERAVRGQSVD